MFPLLLFEYHHKLHHSQTFKIPNQYGYRFEYHHKLHHSQTPSFTPYSSICLSTIINYTILKLKILLTTSYRSLSTIINYTILKLNTFWQSLVSSLSTIINYTILKRSGRSHGRRVCLSTIINYTILKPQILNVMPPQHRNLMIPIV